ncbi:MAG: hypothetical protein IJK18_06945 [Clostridia bacterium]|nr:hypothetical protein [Clostridia bacterium]
METLIIAHRGANKLAPENTLSSFKKAKEIGADGIETDVQLTKDGKMVLHHNYTIDANSNGSGRIDIFSLEELKKFDFGICKGEEFKGERIPTLDELFEIAKDFKVINIELKAPMDKNIPYVEMVADSVMKSGLIDKIIISAFDKRLLRKMKKYNPKIRIGILTWREISRKMLEFLPNDMIINEVTKQDIKLPENKSKLDELGANEIEIISKIWNSVFSKTAVYNGLKIGEIIDEIEQQDDLLRYVQKLDFKVDYVHAPFEKCFENEDLVNEMHKRGIGVNVWTPSTEDDLNALLKYDLDGIITNSPEILIKSRS